MHTGIVTFCVSITFTMLFILTTVFSVITLSSVFSLIAVCSEWSVSAVFSIFTVSGVSGVFIARGPFQSRRGADSSHREAALLSTMNHPNIVAFRDSFEADEHLYIVMEYCAGGDILQRIKGQRNALFTQDVILNWFGQMCLGTKYIHDQRVLHRDLKSKNIFLASNGAVKLGDFGSACVLKSSEAYAYTYVGTPYYVSPEIWDSKPYNNKSDVWSLGCVLYELCTLRHPFQAASWKSLILKVCRGAYPPLPSHLPYELHHLIKHMFKTNPRDRPSLNTILTSHRISRLLRKHLPPQGRLAVDPQVLEGGQAGKWKKKEGVKVATYLGQKSLLESSRSLAAQSTPEDPGTTGPRRQWDKRPPERLLSLLEKAPVSLAFETYTVHREAGGNPLVGPLSQAGWDDTDGLAEDLLDSQRLEPRSDDEDTDFEEDSPCDLIGELEKITLSL
ncbi:serine/threonine-protein kinase Nek3 isoform X5 [Scleropages formosus]|uniref:serine/threonine-protein kinase Nek3 isoform X5 n=1 Tax=Scleropages formosus TaxID=113540 RepID=UPI0010FA948C|nr:serine/threonine-protein kinase Nek3 isoform X5 [Scleropages formosus]